MFFFQRIKGYLTFFSVRSIFFQRMNAKIFTARENFAFSVISGIKIELSLKKSICFLLSFKIAII